MICLKISIFVVSNTTKSTNHIERLELWFAWKFLSLWYQTQPFLLGLFINPSCDLLENFYLCGIKHNLCLIIFLSAFVVICLKISIFVVSNTTVTRHLPSGLRCDLLENFYLCGIKHNLFSQHLIHLAVVICLNISIFVVSNTTRNNR